MVSYVALNVVLECVVYSRCLCVDLKELSIRHSRTHGGGSK